MHYRWRIGCAVLTALMILFLVGCSSPEQKARKLFDEGKYEEVVAQYPDLPIAQQAKEKLAEKMFNEGDYAGVIEMYPDSPFASQAKMKMADDLLAKAQAQTDEAAKKEMLQQVVDQYPDTEAAAKAKEMLAPPEKEQKQQRKK